MRRALLTLLTTTAFLSLLNAQAESPLWMRYPAISPNGQSIAFSYKGDIYLVPASGGLAYPVTLHEANDYAPVWSPDGRQIAFASARHGNADVFIMPVGGGAAKRLTYHAAGDRPSAFTPDGKHLIFSSARLDIASNQQFPSGVLPELYQVSVEGGTPHQLLAVPALDAKFDSRGQRLVYHDRKGYEDEFRKHHTSSVTRDVWLYDMKADSFRQLTEFAGEDRNPVFMPNQNTIYYLSEESGSFNVFKMPVDQPMMREPVTTFDTHPVRYLSVSDNGLLCFSYNGELYTMREGEEPRKVPVQIATGERYSMTELHAVKGGATELALSPNGKEVAFVYRGEVFVSSVVEGTTRRITHTPEQERSVSFSPDGRRLLYATERDSSWDVYQASIKREEEPYFFNATLIAESPVVNTPADEFQPAYAPNGEEVAFLEERTTLRVINLKNKAVRTVLPGDRNYSYSDGDQHYEWSPDSKWLLVEFLQPEQWISQAGLVRADGSGEVTDLTHSGYGANRPQWMMDGQMMLWFSNRDGQKNHGSWGGEADAYALFFTQEAYDRFQLDEEAYRLLKEQEEEAEEKDDAADAEDKEEEAAPLKLELEDIDDRRVRLTIHSSDLSDAYVNDEGTKLYYLARFEKGYDLWETDLKSRETKILAKLNSPSGSALIPDKEGKHLFLLAGGSIKKVNLESGEAEGIGIDGEMTVDAQAERAYLFEHVWRQVDKKFYKPELHGTDWDMYVDNYRRFLPHINNNQDFADMLSELLGELNASHTGARYRPDKSDGDQTASLGLYYDEDYEGDGMRITEVMDKGPADKDGARIAAGHIIEAVNGQELQGTVNFYSLLNRQAGKPMLLQLYDPQNKERYEARVEPISSGAENQLRYERWVENCRDIVDSLSGGRIGYVHVRGMNDESYRTVYDEVLGRHASKEALVVDTRFNGGGWLHDDLATFLSGEPYVTLMPRGQNLGSEPLSKWSKPSVVVMSESNYSDAHMFPYAYKALGIGKLVGMPVPGTATAVWWERLHTGDLIFGIPQVGVVTNEGEYLENNQLEPDIRQPNEPGKVRQGYDQQLKAAVDELLRQLEQE